MSTSTLVTRPTAAPATVVQPLLIANGTVEAMKWLALAAMTIDHVNKHLLQGGVAWMFGIGRLAMPIFVFVLAYNLMRPSVHGGARHDRIVRRLLLWAVVATPLYIALNGLLPLNILFMLATIGAMLRLKQLRSVFASMGAVILFALAGFFVEYWWPGIAIGLASAAYCVRPTNGRLAWLGVAIAAAAGFLALLMIGAKAPTLAVAMNACALAVVPLVAFASRVELNVPRLRYVFYGYYPIHLAVLWAVTHYR